MHIARRDFGREHESRGFVTLISEENLIAERGNVELHGFNVSHTHSATATLECVQDERWRLLLGKAGLSCNLSSRNEDAVVLEILRLLQGSLHEPGGRRWRNFVLDGLLRAERAYAVLVTPDRAVMQECHLGLHG